MRTLSTWFRPPRFRRASEEGSDHRQATWLELFFDLVFVVNVAGLVSILRADLSAEGFGMFALMFALTWWLWMDVSYYGDQFDSDGVVYRVALLAIMFAMIATARVTPALIGDAATHWPMLVYAGTYVILFGLYAWAYRPNPELRPLVRSYLGAMAVGAVGYGMSAFAAPPGRYWVWGATLALLMAHSPWLYWRLPELPSQLSHMPERFGLFGIIALGESIVAVSQGVAGTPVEPHFVGLAVAAFALGASLWWVFFNREDPGVISEALDSGQRGLLRGQVYGARITSGSSSWPSARRRCCSRRLPRATAATGPAARSTTCGRRRRAGPCAAARRRRSPARPS